MSGTVELRRFRTWNSDAADARPGWSILVRYHARTLLRTWYTATMLVITAVFLALGIGTAVAGWSDPVYPMELSSWDLGAGVVAFSLLPAAVFVLLVGAPLFAEDLRYNAPLFYFSRPLRPAKYFQGKLVFLGGLLGAVAFVPAVLLLVLGLLLRVGPQTVETGPRALATGADAFHALAVVVPGILVALLWLAAVTLFVSAHTRRAWHAAMGVTVLVGAWSLVGASAQVLGSSALKHLGGPGGWINLLFWLPLDVRYHDRAVAFDERRGWDGSAVRPDDHELFGVALTAVYVLMLTTSLLALWATNRRLRRMEAIL